MSSGGAREVRLTVWRLMIVFFSKKDALKSQITAGSVNYEQWTQVIVQQGLCLSFTLLRGTTNAALFACVWMIAVHLLR